MTIGNAWLGSLVAVEVSTQQQLAAGSCNIATPVLSIASTVDWVTVHLADQTETVSISLTPTVGTAYSTLCYQTSSSGHSAFFWQPDRPLFLAAGEYVTVRVTNAGASGTASVALLTLY